MVVGKFWGPYNRGRQIRKIEEGVTLYPGDVLIRKGHAVNIGTAGMSDLFGSSPMTIGQADVGRTVPVLTAIEIKAGKDQLRPGQPEFLKFVTDLGGRAGVARTAEEGVRIVGG